MTIIPLYLGLILYFQPGGCLTGMKVIIPVAVKQGETALLRCNYNLEGDQLYSLKWYKDGREFYRYTPKERPPQKEFRIAGLTVILERSNGTDIALDAVTVENSGGYTCEVSADAPSFFTGMKSGVLQVVEVPIQDPQISGLKPRYRPGEQLKAECESRGSRPAANLTWLVNGEPVDAARIRHHKPHESKGLFNAHLGLKLQITQQLFSRGRLKIRCVASMHDIYYRSSEKSADLERRRAARPPPPPPPAESTTHQQTADDWEYALSAERDPQDTLIFTLEGNKGGRTEATTTTTTVLLLTLIISALRRAR